MPSDESQTVVGDVLEHDNGDRYIVLPNGKLAYLGNRQIHRSTGLVERTGKPCKVLGRMALLPYVSESESEFDDIQSDWDTLRGIERFPAPLPKGCTCGHDALTAVLNCRIHEVKIRDRPLPPKTIVHCDTVQFQRDVGVPNPGQSAVFGQGLVIWRDYDGMWSNGPFKIPERQVASMLKAGWVQAVNRSDFDTYPSVV